MRMLPSGSTNEYEPINLPKLWQIFKSNLQKVLLTAIHILNRLKNWIVRRSIPLTISPSRVSCWLFWSPVIVSWILYAYEYCGTGSYSVLNVATAGATIRWVAGNSTPHEHTPTKHTKTKKTGEH